MLSAPSSVAVKKWKVAAVPAPARVSQVAESDEVEARVARGGGGGSVAASQIVRVEPDGAWLAVPQRPRLEAGTGPDSSRSVSDSHQSVMTIGHSTTLEGLAKARAELRDAYHLTPSP